MFKHVHLLNIYDNYLTGGISKFNKNQQVQFLEKSQTTNISVTPAWRMLHLPVDNPMCQVDFVYVYIMYNIRINGLVDVVHTKRGWVFFCSKEIDVLLYPLIMVHMNTEIVLHITE